MKSVKRSRTPSRAARRVVTANATAARLERGGLDRLRKLCLAFPQAEEVQAWGDPTFRVRNKIFAMHKVGDGRPSLWCKALPGVQPMLVAKSPERYYVPPYVGHRGWIGVRLDGKVPWREVEGLVAISYRMTAPKRLADGVRVGGPRNPSR